MRLVREVTFTTQIPTRGVRLVPWPRGCHGSPAHLAAPARRWRCRGRGPWGHRRPGVRGARGPVSGTGATARRRRGRPPQVRERVPQRRRHPVPRSTRHEGCRRRHDLDPPGCRRRLSGRAMRYDDVLGLIGNTPLVGIHELSPNPDVAIFAKLEGQNPGGSSKDRIALKMVELAEKEGVLRPGDTILEPTSGNTGIGLAIVARRRGYRLRVVMPQNVSVERRQLLEIFGAEIVLSPGGEGSNGAIRMSEQIAVEHPEFVRLFQYGNPANPIAHYEGTGPEIWRDCPEVDVFVAGLGTSGTLMGVGRYLKERNPSVQVVAVEPPSGELVQGLRSLDDGFVPPIFDPSVLDRKLIVRPRESIEWVRRLLEQCGVFAGISSGAAVAGAVKVAAEMDAGTIVTLLPDGGWKYLSSGAWTDDLDEVVERATKINYW